MPNETDNIWGGPVYRYTRAQAIADGVPVDLTEATDDRGQRLCQQAGFKVPVALTRAAWAATVEAGGTWKPDDQGEVLVLKGGQSLTGRLWDVLWMLHLACQRSVGADRVHFEVRVDINGDGRHRVVRLWALCGPGDNAEPVITIMLEGED